MTNQLTPVAAADATVRQSDKEVSAHSKPPRAPFAAGESTESPAGVIPRDDSGRQQPMEGTTTPQGHTRRRLILASAPAAAGALAAACAGIGDQTGGTAERKPVTVAFLTNWAGGTRLETLQKALP